MGVGEQVSELLTEEELIGWAMGIGESPIEITAKPRLSKGIYNAK